MRADIVAGFEWWAWVDLNHRPRPYQLSTYDLRWSFTDCYSDDSQRWYRRFSPLLLCYLLRWFLIEGGHKIGHSVFGCVNTCLCHRVLAPEDF